MHLVGVDSGGTFTDTVIVTDDGRVAVGKALSTPGHLADGVMASIEAAAVDLGSNLESVLGATRLLAHGTTAGVNALLTGTGGRVALLTTEGFEDAVAIARINKVLGIEESLLTQATRWEKPPALLPRRWVKGIRERVDARGEVMVALDEEQARAAIRELAGDDVQAVGICLLWSFLHPEHEERVARIVAEELPGVHVTTSTDLIPRIGEYERAMTVLLNAYVAPIVSGYLGDLERRLTERSFTGRFYVMQSSSGVQRAATLARRPVETLRSGPVGGISAAIAIGRRLGHEQIVSTDVGGTSFDVGLVVDGQPQYARRPMIDRYAIAMPVVDIESIGTGGGSIAWIDAASGTLRVGPQSAGADPGPVCYGRGGVQPTVTDAAVALGYVERLGGNLDLDRSAARDAIERSLVVPLGMSLEEAAEGTLDIANAQMADLVRRVTVQRGHDPSDFVLYAFGGAAPQYAGRYSLDLGVADVVIPVFAPVFSAYGAVASDLRTSAQFDAPRAYPPPPSWLTDRLAELERRVTDELSSVRDAGPVTIERSVGLRFRRQVHELRMPLPRGALDEAELAATAASFEVEYERLFGEGTAYTEAGIEMVGLRVDAHIALDSPEPQRDGTDGREPEGSRKAFFGGQWHDCPVWDAERLAPDVTVAGPAFLEAPTTTVVVYPGQAAREDVMGNVFLTSEVTA